MTQLSAAVEVSLINSLLSVYQAFLCICTIAGSIVHCKYTSLALVELTAGKRVRHKDDFGITWTRDIWRMWDGMSWWHGDENTGDNNGDNVTLACHQHSNSGVWVMAVRSFIRPSRLAISADNSSVLLDFCFTHTHTHMCTYTSHIPIHTNTLNTTGSYNVHKNVQTWDVHHHPLLTNGAKTHFYLHTKSKVWHSPCVITQWLSIAILTATQQ